MKYIQNSIIINKYYAKNTWKYHDWGLFSILSKGKESHYAFGLVFPAYFPIGKDTNVEVVYRPTFYRPNMTDKFVYEHLISIDFAGKIRLKQ